MEYEFIMLVRCKFWVDKYGNLKISTSDNQYFAHGIAGNGDYPVFALVSHWIE